jgi:hypothetical protein
MAGTSIVKGAGPQVGKTRELAEEEVERAHDIGMTVEFGPVRLTKVSEPQPTYSPCPELCMHACVMILLARVGNAASLWFF